MKIEINLQEFKSLLNSGFSNEQLSAYFNCGITTIKRYKNQNNLVGYKTNSKPLSLKQIEEIVVLSEKGYSLQEISKLTNRTDYILKKYLPNTVYKQILVNSRNAFANNLIKANTSNIFVPSAHSAYICGVLQSDGYLTSDGYIGLTAKDKDFVENFASFFKTRIREYTKNGVTYFGCRFKDIRNLEKFKEVTNIYPNKTYSSYNVPTWISTDIILLKNFIAGVFDGDGWVYKVKDRLDTLEIGIEQHRYSKEFLEYINQFLEWNIYSTDTTFRIHTKNKEKVKEFYNWYSNIEFIMLRKISIFDSIYL